MDYVLINVPFVKIIVTFYFRKWEIRVFMSQDMLFVSGRTQRESMQGHLVKFAKPDEMNQI